MDLKESIGIRVNGDPRRVSARTSIAGMLSELGLDPRKVAVERNREIVPRSTLRRGPRRATATCSRSSISSAAVE